MATVSQVITKDAYQEFRRQVRIVIAPDHVVINSPICPMFV